MYDLKLNITPWEIPFEIRMKKILDFIKQEKYIALYIYEKADTSTFRYRVYNIYQSFSEEFSDWKVVYFFGDEIKLILEYIKFCKILVLARTRWDYYIQKIIDTAKYNNVKVSFDVDDLVFDLDFMPLLTNTLNIRLQDPVEYDFWVSYIGRLYMTASLCDYFISTNDFLAEQLNKKFKKNVYIIPNSINKEQYNYSSYILEQKKISKKMDTFILGYFSGTASHVNDFKLIAPEIKMLLEDFKDMKLLIVGFMEFPAYMNQLINEGKIIYKSLVDFLELQRLIAEVDVNIVPLIENTFTNCKSELKFFEASIVDVPTCASPTFTYKNSITNKLNGFLCNQGDWYNTIENIYNENYDIENIVKNAKEYCIKKYYIENIQEQIEKVFCDILEN